MSDDNNTIAERLYPSMAESKPAARPSDGGQADSRADGQGTADRIYNSRDGKPADDGYTPWTDRMGEDADKSADEAKADRDKGTDKPDEAKGERGESEEQAKGDSFDLDAAADDLNLDREHEAYGDLKTAVDELGLDKAGAEKLVDAHQNANAAEWNRISKGWVEEATSAPDADVTIKDAQALMQSSFIDPELRQYLSDTPFGNHPGLIRSLAKIKRALAL